MTPLDTLLANVKLLMPKANINTDLSHGPRSSHFAIIRIEHALIVLIHNPTKEYIRVSTEVDADCEGTDEVEFKDSDTHSIVDWIVHHIVLRGLA